MVLINELTVEQINAALLHLQRSKDEVVGGVKGNTTQNISITNSGGGGGNNVDYSGAIQNLANNIEKNSESIEEVKVDVHNLEETIRNLSDAGISDLSYDNFSHQLTITTENGDTFQTQIIQDVATLSFDPATNELSITTGEQTQTITLPAQVQSDWTQTDSTEPDFIKNKIPIWITSGSADDNMSPVDVVEPGNTRPVTSGGVANALALPTDAVLHYSFDELPDYPDGTSVYYRNNNFVSSDNWRISGGTITYNNSLVYVAGSQTSYIYKSITSTNGIVVKIKFRYSDSGNFLALYATGGTPNRYTIKTVANEIIEFSCYFSGNVTAVGFTNISASSTLEILALYIGNGSYNTPVIDNADGQWNSISQNGVTVQGVSGKGVKQWDSRIEMGNFNLNDNFTISIWVNPENNTTGKLAHILRKDGQFILRNGTVTNAELQAIVIQNNQATVIGSSLLSANTWQNLVIIKDNLQFCIYINGTRIRQTTLSQSAIDKNNNVFYIGRYDNNNPNTRPQSYDDLLIFDRALSETEVQALYLNKANTPKYYTIGNERQKKITYGIFKNIDINTSANTTKSGTYTTTKDCILRVSNSGTASSSNIIAWARILIDSQVVCSCMTTTFGSGQTIIVPAGVTISYDLRNNDVVQMQITYYEL